MKRAFFLVVGLVLASAASADVTLPRILSDGMVLQRGVPVRIWGKADPGEAVTVILGRDQRTTIASKDGDWEVRLPRLAAGGPFTLTVRGNDTLTLKDILVGEVWVCSGQSNMEWNVAASADAQSVIAGSADPLLRMFTVRRAIGPTPREDVDGGIWQSADPTTTGGFSAVGYAFAKKLREQLGVPIGMIHTSWGGTRIEAWMDRQTNTALGMEAREYAQHDSGGQVSQAELTRWRSARSLWERQGRPTGSFADPGRAVHTRGWEAPDTDLQGWKPLKVSSLWEDAGVDELAFSDGGVWLRTSVELTADEAKKLTTLSLGPIDDTDITFVNGILVGATGEETPHAWEVKRRYKIPAGTLRAGANVIAVRVWDHQGGGGIYGAPGELFLEDNAGGRKPLSGEWLYRAEQLRAADPGPQPSGLHANSASVLYNAMLHPVRKYSIQGAIWYQGESNAGNPALYEKQLPAMIQNWRAVFENKNAAFYAVQLAPFMRINPEPEDTNWARLREAQVYGTKAVKNAGVAIITDVGEENDIHPRRKGPVGERLALLALKNQYRKRVSAMGPTLRRATFRRGKAILSFDNADGGLIAAATDSAGRPVEPGKLPGFAIAGEDGKFVWGEAKVVGRGQIEVSAPSVPDPRAVRFGWANFPVVNLYNGAGLPAVPFRTDRPKEKRR